MDETLLISLVEKYSLIYDKSRSDFKDKHKKNNAWTAIAAAMNQPVEDCQRCWKNLRERFTREKRTHQNIASGSAATSDSEWIHYDSLGFLLKHIKGRKTSSNIREVPVTEIREESRSGSFSSSPGPGSTSPWAEFDDLTQLSVVENLEELTEASELVGSTYEGTSETNEFPDEPTPSTSRSPNMQMEKPRQETPKNKTKQRHTESLSVVTETLPTPSTSRSPNMQVEKPRPETPKNKTKQRHTEKDSLSVVTETLQNVSNYLKNKNQDDSDMAFGMYVGISLKNMPKEEKNKKKIQILEILGD